jgi:hypothetical protein
MVGAQDSPSGCRGSIPVARDSDVQHGGCSGTPSRDATRHAIQLLSCGKAALISRAAFCARSTGLGSRAEAGVSPKVRHEERAAMDDRRRHHVPEARRDVDRVIVPSGVSRQSSQWFESRDRAHRLLNHVPSGSKSSKMSDRTGQCNRRDAANEASERRARVARVQRVRPRLPQRSRSFSCHPPPLRLPAAACAA